MSSVGRWVLTHTELEPAVHAFLSQFQLERLSFRGWFRSFCLLAREPGPELFILVADKFQGFGHKAEVLAGGEIAGMCGYEIQEAGLVLGVAKPAEVLDAVLRELHGYRLRIAVMISRSSRTRRRPATSSDRA